MVRFYESFMHQGHYVIVFEKLGSSLYDYLYENKQKLSVDQIQNILKQILEQIQFIHEEKKLIHTDLKLENVLIVGRKKKNIEIKVVDFGGATYEKEERSHLIQTRMYRAPEVIMLFGQKGFKFDNKVDIWSIGCIAYELYTNKVLFQAEDSIQHLQIIEMTTGQKMEQEFKHEKKCQKSHKQHTMGISRVRRLKDIKDCGLRSFVESLLVVNPCRRPSARQCLEHLFMET